MLEDRPDELDVFKDVVLNIGNRDYAITEEFAYVSAYDDFNIYPITISDSSLDFIREYELVLKHRREGQDLITDFNPSVGSVVNDILILPSNVDEIEFQPDLFDSTHLLIVGNDTLESGETISIRLPETMKTYEGLYNTSLESIRTTLTFYIHAEDRVIEKKIVVFRLPEVNKINGAGLSEEDGMSFNIFAVDSGSNHFSLNYLIPSEISNRLALNSETAKIDSNKKGFNVVLEKRITNVELILSDKYGEASDTVRVAITLLKNDAELRDLEISRGTLVYDSKEKMYYTFLEDPKEPIKLIPFPADENAEVQIQYDAPRDTFTLGLYGEPKQETVFNVVSENGKKTSAFKFAIFALPEEFPLTFSWMRDGGERVTRDLKNGSDNILSVDWVKYARISNQGIQSMYPGSFEVGYADTTLPLAFDEPVTLEGSTNDIQLKLLHKETGVSKKFDYHIQNSLEFPEFNLEARLTNGERLIFDPKDGNAELTGNRKGNISIRAYGPTSFITPTQITVGTETHSTWVENWEIKLPTDFGTNEFPIKVFSSDFSESLEMVLTVDISGEFDGSLKIQRLADTLFIENYRSISEDLTISNIDGLTDLGFMSQLQRVGSLRLEGLGDLVELKGTENLTLSTGLLKIWNCPLLTTTDLRQINNIRSLDLRGLNYSRLPVIDESIEELDSIILNDLPEFEFFNGLGSLKTIQEIKVTNCPNFLNFSTMDSLETIGGSLELHNTPNLESFNEFQSLVSIAGNLILDGVGSNQLLDMPALTKLGGILIQDANDLELTLSGITHLNTIDFVRLSNCKVDLPGLSTAGNIYMGRLTTTEVSYSLQNVSGSVEIRSVDNTKIDGYLPTQSIGASLRLYSNNQLEALTISGGTLSVDSGFVIDGNDALQTVNLDLAQSEYLGDIHILGNSELTSLSLSDSLTKVSGDFQIDNNRSLTSVDLGNGLANIGGNLHFSGNNSLVDGISAPSLNLIEGELRYSLNDSFTGQIEFQKLARVGRLSIQANPNMIEIPEFPALVEIEGSLDINFNAALGTVEGLEGLKAIQGDLSIKDNVNLDSIIGLDSLQTVSGSVYIIGDVLTNLSGLATLPKISVGGTNIEVRGNMLECDDIDEFKENVTGFSGIWTLSGLTETSYGPCE